MRAMHKRFESGGQTLSEFCVAEGINKHTFQYWRSKIKRLENSELPIGGFQQILPRTKLASSCIRLEYSSARYLELPVDYPAEQLIKIIRGLSC